MHNPRSTLNFLLKNAEVCTLDYFDQNLPTSTELLVHRILTGEEKSNADIISDIDAAAGTAAGAVKRSRTRSKKKAKAQRKVQRQARCTRKRIHRAQRL